MTGKSIFIAGITIRVATARVPGLIVMAGEGEIDGLGETLGLPDGDTDAVADGETLGDGEGRGGRVISTGVSEGIGPAVVGSAYERRPPVSSITPIAVSSAGTTR